MNAAGSSIHHAGQHQRALADQGNITACRCIADDDTVIKAAAATHQRDAQILRRAGQAHIANPRAAFNRDIGKKMCLVQQTATAIHPAVAGINAHGGRAFRGNIGQHRAALSILFTQPGCIGPVQQRVLAKTFDIHRTAKCGGAHQVAIQLNAGVMMLVVHQVFTTEEERG